MAGESICKEVHETFGGDTYLHYSECSDVFKGLYIYVCIYKYFYQHLFNCTILVYVYTLCILVVLQNDIRNILKLNLG